MSLFLMLFGYRLSELYSKAIHYLKAVSIDDDNMTLFLFRRDKEITPVVIPLNELKIDLFDEAKGRTGNTFYVTIKKRCQIKHTEFDLVHKQWETGGWSLENLKLMFTTVRERQGKFSGTASMKRYPLLD